MIRSTFVLERNEKIFILFVVFNCVTRKFLSSCKILVLINIRV